MRGHFGYGLPSKVEGDLKLTSRGDGSGVGFAREKMSD